MSYYSDVALITTKAGWEDLKQKLDQAETPNINNLAIVKRQGEYVLIEWRGVKWYDDPTVDVVEKWKDDEQYNYRWGVIGESYEDNEFHEHTDDYDMPDLWLERRFDFDVEWEEM